MTTIFERVETALGTLSPVVPFALAPYIGTQPDRFIAYQLIDDSAKEHADNVEVARSYLVQVSTWDKTGLIDLPDIDTVMLAAGFKKGSRRQLPKDPKTGHFGLAQDYSYLEFSNLQ